MTTSGRSVPRFSMRARFLPPRCPVALAYQAPVLSDSPWWQTTDALDAPRVDTLGCDETLSRLDRDGNGEQLFDEDDDTLEPLPPTVVVTSTVDALIRARVWYRGPRLTHVPPPPPDIRWESCCRGPRHCSCSQCDPDRLPGEPPLEHDPYDDLRGDEGCSGGGWL